MRSQRGGRIQDSRFVALPHFVFVGREEALQLYQRWTLIGARPGRVAGRSAKGAHGMWTRRQALRAGATAVGALAAVATVGGAEPQAGAATRLTRAAANPVVITVKPDVTVTDAVWEITQEALQPLLKAHPGLEVRPGPNVWQSQAVASLLAGNGPDVFGDWDFTGYPAAGVAMDLTPYIKRDNVDLSIYPKGLVQYIHQLGALSPTNPTGFYALPQLTVPNTMVVNLGILDQLGLSYPQPDWTYQQWARLWEAATVRPSRGKTGRVGGVVDMWGYDFSMGLPAPYVLYGWGGEYVDAENLTRCVLDRSGSIACGEWVFDLFWNNVIVSGDDNSGFANGQIVSATWEGDYLPAAATMFRGLKWDFFTLPRWPVRDTSYTSANLDGIWAGTKHPDAAWLVLKWITTSPVWQRLQMHMLLYPPSDLNLYEEWIAVARQVASPLRDKNLDVFLHYSETRNAYVGNLFRYSSNQVKSLCQHLAQDLASRKVSVREGFSAAAQQINRIEATGRVTNEIAARYQAEVRRYAELAASSRGPVRLPAPSVDGQGRAPTPVKSEVTVRSGSWTVTGGGSGLSGSADGLTYACARSLSSAAAFACRLTSIEAVSPSTLANGAKFGILARGDLSDAAASAGIAVAAGRGVHVYSRPLSGVRLADERASGVTASGLLPASSILLDNTKPARNYLSRPVWLKLVRDMDVWTAYTSLDGRTWLRAGPSMGAQLLGVWVGLCVTAHASGHLVRATFDQLEGFTPDTFVRIGAP